MSHFIHIPKAAGSTLSKLMSTTPGHTLKFMGHVHATELVSVFAFVRNPYDRLVSTYFYLMGDRENFLDKAYHHIVKRYPSFKEFVLSIEPDGLMEVILHLQPMWQWLVNHNGDVIVPVILKIEEPEKIDEYLLKFGLPGWTEAQRENTSDHGDYTSYLDPDIIAVVNRIYEKDFSFFNYETL